MQTRPHPSCNAGFMSLRPLPAGHSGARTPRYKRTLSSPAVQPQGAAERVEVAGGLAARDPPVPLLADGGGEAQLEDRVERAVGVLQDGTEQPVDLRSRHAAEREPGVEVDVTDTVQRKGHGVHLHVALEQPPVDAL